MKHYIELIKRLWGFFVPYRFKFIVALLFAFVMNVAQILSPLILGLGITRLGENFTDMVRNVPGAGVDFSYISKVALAFAIAAILRSVSLWLANILMTDAVQGAVFDIRQAIVSKSNRINVSYYDKNLLGDTLSRITNDVETLSNALQQSLIMGFNSFLGLAFAIVSMFLLNAELAMIAVIAIIVQVITANVLMKASQKTFKKQQDSLGTLFGYIQEQLSGYTEVQAYNREESVIKDFYERNDTLRKYGFRSSFLSSIIQPLSMTIFDFAYLAVVFFGTVKVIANALTLGNLQAYLSYVSQINQQLNAITQLTGIVQSAVSALERVLEYLDEDEEPQREITAKLPEKIKGEVAFDHVQFGYSEKRQLMHDVNFTIKPGQTAAIVGPTGAGKTTLINLLMRFYDVTGGAIRIDGIDTRDISRHDLRKHVGMVLQDTWLFSGSVMENIRYGNLKATDYEVRDVAKVANVDSFIQTLPGSYNMIISENGENISQGQKQLMTIARAILADPDILILDEATSSVDTRLEQLIQNAMDKVTEGRTTFVIAHRLSTIKNADIILVMQDGDIIEHGTHEELMAKNGFYTDLYNSQFANEEEPADIHMSY